MDDIDKSCRVAARCVLRKKIESFPEELAAQAGLTCSLLDVVDELQETHDAIAGVQTALESIAATISAGYQTLVAKLDEILAEITRGNGN